MEFKKIDIIADNENFAVVKVENPTTKEEQIVYVSSYLDLSKDSWTWEELKPIWW